MLKVIFLFVFAISSITSYSQTQFQRLDSITRENSVKGNDVTKITESITQGLQSDLEKVRAIYVWITDNISYDVVLYKDKKARLDIAKKDLKKRLKRTLKKRMAICGGYSELFREMCRVCDIHAESQSGFSKTKISDIGKKRKANHAWNKVKIDTVWYLLDATWGSGELGNYFIKSFDDNYFLTDPTKFYYSHYPEKTNRELDNLGITKADFYNFPLVHEGFFRYVKKMDKHSNNGYQILQEGNDMIISFETERHVSFVDVYNRKKKIQDVEHSNKDGKCTIKFKMDKVGYHYPLIYLNTIPTLSYKVKVEKNDI